MVLQLVIHSPLVEYLVHNWHATSRLKVMDYITLEKRVDNELWNDENIHLLKLFIGHSNIDHGHKVEGYA